MKRAITLLVMALLMVAGVQTAMAQKMVVTTTDNQVVKFDVNKVKQVTFEDGASIGTIEYVDLSLPSGTLWASCNIGASSPEQYGFYFAWGEKEAKNDYSWLTYRYCKGTYDSLTKYCTAEYYGTFDGLDALEDADDAAAMTWGSPWQMPSLDQCKELINSSYTTTEWTTLNGKYGRKITSKTNGNSVFLPAAGTRSGKSLDNAGSYGDYWSRTLHPYNSLNVYFLYFSPNGISTDYYVRSRGQSVRPVHVP